MKNIVPTTARRLGDLRQRQPWKALLFAAILIVIGAALVSLIVVLMPRETLPSSGTETKSGDVRLAALRSDPMYGVQFPAATELRRVERGSLGFSEGIENPPAVVYYAGTSASDDEIVRFFNDSAAVHGWRVQRGPERMSTDDKVTVIYRKEGTGRAILRLFDPDRLNRLLLGEKFPSDTYTTIIQVTLEAEELEPR